LPGLGREEVVEKGLVVVDVTPERPGSKQNKKKKQQQQQRQRQQQQ